MAPTFTGCSLIAITKRITICLQIDRLQGGIPHVSCCCGPIPEVEVAALGEHVSTTLSPVRRPPVWSETS